MKLKSIFMFMLAILMLSTVTMATDNVENKVEIKEKIIDNLVKHLELKADYTLCKENEENNCNKILKKSKAKFNLAKKQAKRNKINFQKHFKIAKERYAESLIPEPVKTITHKKKAKLEFKTHEYDDFTTFYIKTYKMDSVNTIFEDGEGLLIAKGSKTKQRTFDNENTIIKGIRFDCPEKTCRVSFKLEKDGSFEFRETSDFETIDLYVGNRWLTMRTNTKYLFI